MITNNTLSEIGDVLIIYSQVIVNALISISSYNDNLFGVTPTKYFYKQFKYSMDGLNYSDWQDLNNINLQQINGIVNGLLFFEFRYERVGTDNTGILEFNGIELIGDIQIQICENTSTLESIFSDLSQNDFYTMTVRNNILRKIFHHGILPKFIERGDNVDNTDFISFWSAVCIYLSYFSSFANNFDNIIFKREYLAEYIKQYNIQIDEKEIIYQHLFYISTNFYDEIRKRGTQMTLKLVGTELVDGTITPIDGEWLRLICRNHYDEFLIEIISKETSGFCLGKSSPMYNGTYFSKQLNKTEENTSDFLDLNKYTTMGYVNSNLLDNKKCLNLGYYMSGLGYDLQNPPTALNVNELITIDESIDYEITFNFKRTSDAYNNMPELNVGVLCYNRNGVLLTNATQNIQNNIPTNRFFKQSMYSISKVKDEWYSFRAILYSKNSVNISDSRTNLNKGNHLKIGGKNSQRVEKVKICLYSDIPQQGGFEKSESYFNIHDFKMRPLVRGKNILKTFLGKGEFDQKIYQEPYIKNPQFLQSNTFCLNWRRNNNQDKSENQVDNFIQNYLLPYQQKLISIPLTPYVDDKQILI
jgi:hypothetical protein